MEVESVTEDHSSTGSVQPWADWSEKERPKTDLAERLAARALEHGRRARPTSAPGSPSSRPGDDELVDRWMRLAGVPELYREATWFDCPVHPQLRGWTLNMPGRARQGEGLMLFGPTGTGKSSTAALVAREALRQGLTVRWVYVPQLLGTLSTAPERRKETTKHRVADLVVWDDFGAAELSDQQVQWLDALVEVRYGRRQSMVVTSNLHPQRLVADARMGRMVDRWRQRTMALEMGGESLRQPMPAGGA